MSDRELLELAAKAARHVLLNILDYEDGSSCYGVIAAGDGAMDFDPLNDDGDALRLVVKLRLSVNHYGEGTSVMLPHYSPEGFSTHPAITEESKGDPYAATRRAIVRAAAEIGKQGGDKP